PVGEVSVGSAGAERRITNLAAGSADTDAVNVSQLKAASTHYYSVNDGGTVGGNYNNNGATGIDALAAGVDSTATGLYSTAIGRASTATGQSSVAVGDTAGANSPAAIAIGLNSQANAGSSTAIGNNATVNSTFGIAMGYHAKADDDGSPSSEGATAIGDLAYSKGAGATALGYNASASVGGTTAVGTQSTASGSFSSAFGAGAKTSDEYATALGSGASASGTGSIAAGTNASASGYGALAMGYASNASGVISTAVGPQANASGDYAVALGYLAQGVGGNGVALGSSSTASGLSSVALGAGSQATADNSVALGANSTTTADLTKPGYNPSSTAAIAGTSPVGEVSVGVGGSERRITNLAAGSADTDAVNVSQLKAASTHYYSVNDGGVASGNYNNDGASGTNALAAGVNAVAGSSNSVAMGNGAQAKSIDARDKADNAIAIGNQAISNATGGVSLGSGATVGVLATNSVAIGTGAWVNTNANNAVAIGGGAQTVAPDAAAIGANSIAYAQSVALGSGANGGSTVGTGDVAVGYNASTPSNHGTAIGWKAVAGGDWTQALATAVGSSAEALKQGSTALGESATASAMNATALGWDSNATAAGGVAIGSNSVANTGSGVAGFVPAGVGSTQSAAIAATTGTQGAVSVGNASSGVFRQINGVAAGTVDSDAVNVAQLKAVDSKASAGWNLQANGGTASNVAPGGTVNVVNGNNINVTQNGNQLTIATADDVSFNSVTTGNTKLDTNGLTITGGPSFTATNIDAAGQQIHGVAAGTASTDAVNVSQLTQQGTDLTAKGLSFAGNSGTVHTNLGDTLVIAGAAATVGTYSGNNLKTVADPTTGAVNLQMADNPEFTSVKTGNTTIDNSGLTINGGPSITTAGIDAGNTKIVNVAPGDVSATSTDAVNGSQLNATNQNVTNLGDTVNNFAGDQSTTNTTVNGRGIRYVRTNDAGLPVSDAFAQGQGSTAVGYEAKSTGADALALGRNAQASADNSVALGANSTTTADLTTPAYNPGTGTIAGTAPVGEVSVGSAGAERRITNLAAGAADTDAVNVSQLKSATAASVADAVMYDNSTHNSVTLGGDTYNTTTKTGGTVIHNVAAGTSGGDAVNVDQLNQQGSDLTAKGLNFAGNSGAAVHTNLGDTLTIAGTATTAGTYSGNNLKTVTDPATGAVNLQMADNPEFTSVKTGNTTINDSGLTIAGGPSFTATNIDAAGQQIHGVAAGTASTDAVNVSQLTQQGSDLTAKGLNFAGNSGTVHTNLGDTLVIAGAAATVGTYSGNNLKTVADPTTGAVNLQMADNPEFTSVKTGNTTIDNSGLTINGGPSITTAGIDAGNTKIVNVAPGDVSATSTDAVNGSQLYQTNQT
ncbi:autotransporter adhesin, partial [Cupriavidus metallidurans]